jgi:hypothetical protein
MKVVKIDGVHFRGKVGQAALDQIRIVDKAGFVIELGDIPASTAATSQPS